MQLLHFRCPTRFLSATISIFEAGETDMAVFGQPRPRRTREMRSIVSMEMHSPIVVRLYLGRLSATRVPTESLDPYDVLPGSIYCMVMSGIERAPACPKLLPNRIYIFVKHLTQHNVTHSRTALASEIR